MHQHEGTDGQQEGDQVDQQDAIQPDGRHQAASHERRKDARTSLHQ
jgi:hypothetical protein